MDKQKAIECYSFFNSHHFRAKNK